MHDDIEYGRSNVTVTEYPGGVRVTTWDTPDGPGVSVFIPHGQEAVYLDLLGIAPGERGHASASGANQTR
jgi:hypothetical protein